MPPPGSSGTLMKQLPVHILRISTLADLISSATVILKGSQPLPQHQQHLQPLGTMPLLGSLATPMKQLPVTNLFQSHQT